MSHLRTHVVKGPNAGYGFFQGYIERQPEISKLQLSSMAQKQVLYFDIPALQLLIVSHSAEQADVTALQHRRAPGVEEHAATRLLFCDVDIPINATVICGLLLRLWVIMMRHKIPEAAEENPPVRTHKHAS